MASINSFRDVIANMFKQPFRLFYCISIYEHEGIISL